MKYILVMVWIWQIFLSSKYNRLKICEISLIGWNKIIFCNSEKICFYLNNKIDIFIFLLPPVFLGNYGFTFYSIFWII